MNFNPLPADKFSFPVTYAVISETGNKSLALAKDTGQIPDSGGTADMFGAESVNNLRMQRAVNNVSARNSHPLQIDLLAGDVDEVFALASVTKLLAAYAILIGVEHGDFTLDLPAGPQGSTLAHLLAHASGLPATAGAPIAPPGKRRIYSNYGFDLLARWVEKYTGKQIEQYLIDNLLAPLQMDQTQIPGSIAYSGYSSLDSLLRFAGELLAPKLISRELFEKAVNPVFAGIPGILPGYGRQADNAWGLGFEIRAQKHPHWLAPDFSARTFGHFGQSGSFLWVDPQVGKAGVFLGAQKFGQEHLRIWPELSAQMRAFHRL